jgi:3'-phosphoadenosine 5'-phosphosulfate sulfotransferase (PAPS reductase)/FAD synthetase
MRQVVGLSGGKDSTCLALALREREPADYDYLFTPAGNEPAELFAFITRLESLLGKSVIRPAAFDGDGLVALIRHYNALPNHRQRWCTRQLKIEPAVAWLKANAPLTYFVGLRADEEERPGIYGEIPGVTIRYPLREWGWDVEDVWGYLAEKGIRVPRRTGCWFCYGQTLGEWYRLYRDQRDVWDEGKELERTTGHTFRSPSRDSWPASLEGLERAFESRIPRGERRPGSIQLDLLADDAGADQGPCRVCTL